MEGEKKYKGVRRRQWGKWVSEVRVPGSRERLWLGSYATPEAAAVAHDTAVFLLRGPSSSSGLNFPDRVSALGWAGGGGMSPRSVQRVASDSGMAVDAEMVERGRAPPQERRTGARGDTPLDWFGRGGANGAGVLDISVDDIEIYL